MGDPFIRARVEEIEGEGSAVEHLVVEAADVELGAQLFLGAVAEFAELELAELIAEGLGGPSDVAVRLRLDGGLIDGAGLAEELHDLIAGPAFGVDSGINDETDGAEQLRGEAAVVRDRILVEADLFAELLCVQGPAFNIGVEAQPVEAELGQVRKLLLD